MRYCEKDSLGSRPNNVKLHQYRGSQVETEVGECENGPWERDPRNREIIIRKDVEPPPTTSISFMRHNS